MRERKRENRWTNTNNDL